jgi:hypothetical protein
VLRTDSYFSHSAILSSFMLVMKLQKLLELLFFFFAFLLQLMLGDGAAKRIQPVYLGVKTAAN